MAGAAVLVVLLGGHALTGWGAEGTAGAEQPLAVAATAPTAEDGPAAEDSAEVDPAPDPAVETDGAELTGDMADRGPGESPEGTQVPGPEPEGGETELPGGIWGQVVDRLDAARAAALAEADPARLDAVYVEGSAALAADRAAVAELNAAGLSVRGARHELREVTVLEEEPGRVRLLVVDVLPAHEVLDREGQPVERRSGRGPAPVQLDLVAPDGVDAGDGWRISAVSRP